MRGHRSWFWLYRPTAPTVRAQSIQVVQMAHAMARRGRSVTLAVDPPRGQAVDPASVLAFYGLEPVSTLRLVVLPQSRTVASVVYRALFWRWVRSTGGEGIVYARSKRYAREALRRLGKRFRLVVEAHEVDSVQAAEKGEDPTAFRALEAEVLASADAVVTNCPGTLELLRETHPGIPPALALHNATHESRVRHPSTPGEGVGYVGSVRDYKDTAILARAAALTRATIHVVGTDPSAPAAAKLQAIAGGRLVLEPALPHRDVPDRLAAFRTLVLPLAPGLFGERLTSPLKLWDYLASGRPIVGADLPSLRSAAEGAFEPYAAGDAEALARAIERVSEDEALRARLLGAARVRTWTERAAEVDAFVAEALR